MSKLVLFANTDWYLYNFRKRLAQTVIDRGHDVLLVSPDGPYGSKLVDEGFRWKAIDLFGGAKNPFSNAQALRSVYRLYRDEQPDLVHHFTIKCVLFGGIAARRLGIPAVNAVTGLGHVFTDDRLQNRMLRPCLSILYRYACGGPSCRTVFQNTQDQSHFHDCGLVDPTTTRLIRGSGADTDRFKPSSNERPSGPCRILFASRIIREKGIDELVEACQILRGEGLDFELQIAGDIYPGNPSSLSADELNSLKSKATLLGQVDDLVPVMADADIVVLPSYREGTPRVLLEGGAAGKPLVATDIAGCRGVVEPEENGFLVPVRSVAPLADALRKLIVSDNLRRKFGRRSREVIEAGFSETSVNQRTIDVYNELGEW